MALWKYRSKDTLGTNRWRFDSFFIFCVEARVGLRTRKHLNSKLSNDNKRRRVTDQFYFDSGKKISMRQKPNNLEF